MTLRLGTRRSQLAMTQSTHIAEELRALGADVELVGIHSQGDVDHQSLSQLGGVGVFAAALRLELLAGECDLAVHSFKDLPTARVPGLEIAAVPVRSDHHDVIICRDDLTLETLPPGSFVGTGSPRRAAAVLSLRPDLVIVDIRGNVGTRLGRVKGYGGAEDLDAVVLAAAGLRRLGHDAADAQALPGLPAPAQGALAVEIRSDDPDVKALVAVLDDPATRACAVAERAVLAGLQAGCAAPVAAGAVISGDTITLTARVTSLDGTRHIEVTDEAPCGTDEDHQALGLKVARILLAEGAGKVTELGATKPLRSSAEQRWGADGIAPDVNTGDAPLAGRTIFIPRVDDDHLTVMLRDAGANVHAHPLTRTQLATSAQPDLKRFADGEVEWVILTSHRSVIALACHLNGHAYRDDPDYSALADLARGSHARFAVLGARTATWLRRAGIEPTIVVDGHATAETMVEQFTEEPSTAWLPASSGARDVIANTLIARGWQVTRTALYDTIPVDELPAQIRTGWTMGMFDAAVILAASQAEAAAQLLGAPHEGTALVAFGHPSAAALQRHGLPVASIAATQDAPGLRDAVIAALQATLV